MTLEILIIKTNIDKRGVNTAAVNDINKCLVDSEEI